MRHEDAADPIPVVLQAEGICKSYDTGAAQLDVLRGIDLTISEGEIIAIQGASGVGKSTLLHILGALDRPTQGRVIIDSTDIFSLPDDQIAHIRNQRIGFVFQSHHLLPEFTAVENVMMPLMIARREQEEAFDRARDLLTDVGLGERLSHKPGELSGGEQQRVAVARALVCRPMVVLADEPSGNLDPRVNGKALLDMIWTLSRAHRQAFVIVTHDEGIGRRADRRCHLVDGHLNEIAREPRR